mmetsp:Transcript_1170/g.1540  ORF Transcript_1170/g.1540 Transcript_1170/m.1540 type:complete len:331 (+) Transcript_1170:115-1107(+)
MGTRSEEKNEENCGLNDYELNWIHGKRRRKFLQFIEQDDAEEMNESIMFVLGDDELKGVLLWLRGSDILKIKTVHDKFKNSPVISMLFDYAKEEIRYLHLGPMGSMPFVPKSNYLNNKEFWIYFLLRDRYGHYFKNLHTEKIVLRFAADELKSDKDVILAAVKYCGDALYYAADKLKSDPDVIRSAVRNNGYSLRFAADELKLDPEIVKIAVQSDEIALKCADEFKSDYGIVMTAVQSHPFALQYAADELKLNHEIVLQAVRRNAAALIYAADELKADRDFMIRAVQEHGVALKYASDELKSDRDIVRAAVAQSRDALYFAAMELRLELQ